MLCTAINVPVSCNSRKQITARMSGERESSLTVHNILTQRCEAMHFEVDFSSTSLIVEKLV